MGRVVTRALLATAFLGAAAEANVVTASSSAALTSSIASDTTVQLTASFTTTSIAIASTSTAVTGLEIDGMGSYYVSGSNAYRCFEIYGVGTQVMFKGLTLTNGAASGSTGGALHVDSGATVTLESVTVTSSKAQSSGSGGGIYVSASAVAVLLNSHVTFCVASYMGGGVYVANGGTLQMYGGTFTHNVAESQTGAYLIGRGGALFLEAGASAALNGTTVTDNSAGQGNAFYVASGATLDLDASTISSNSYGHEESSQYWNYWIRVNDHTHFEWYWDTSSCSYCYIYESYWLSYANSYGASYANSYARTYTCSVEYCRTRYSYGGAAYVLGTLTGSGSTFSDNAAYTQGGALFLASSAVVDLSGTTFTSNSAATSYGGAIYSSGASLTLTSCTFTSNSGVTYGSAIYSSGGTIDLVGGYSFSGNSGTAGYNNVAGSATMTVHNGCPAETPYNEGTGNLYCLGTGLTCYSSFFPLEIDLKNCHAGGQGRNFSVSTALELESAMLPNSTIVLVNDFSLAENLVTVGWDTNYPHHGLTLDGQGLFKIDGGNAYRCLALTGSGTAVTVQDIELTNGYASASSVWGATGAGIYVGAGASLTLLRSTVSSSSTNYGAGLYAGSGTTLNLESVVFNGNTGATQGGGEALGLWKCCCCCCCFLLMPFSCFVGTFEQDCTLLATWPRLSLLHLLRTQAPAAEGSM